MKLYLAGPDVFLPDAANIGKVKCELCARYGFVGLFPLDNEIRISIGAPISKAVFDGNIAMLDNADAVLANLTPYRSVSADVGTVFEMGYGYARGKKIFGYSNVLTPFIDRVQSFTGGTVQRGSDDRLYAADRLAVEDFGRFDNLMIAEALLTSGANVVTPETEPADLWRDMRAFEQALMLIRASAVESTRLAIAR